MKIESFDTREAALAAEGEAIRLEEPLFNKVVGEEGILIRIRTHCSPNWNGSP